MTADDLAARLLHLRGAGLAPGDPVAAPLILTSMYHLPGDPAGLRGYGRAENPTWEALEAGLGHLEGAEAVAFPSGMAAISAALMATLKAGDRLLLPSDGYYTTRLLAERFLEPLGIAVEMRPTAKMGAGDLDRFAVVLLESPSNPLLDLCDIAAIAGAVRAVGGVTLADNTAMTPFGQRPLDLGADLVMASDTKAPSGHSDVLMGHVAGRDAALMARVRDWRKLAGAIPGPMECWLALRGLETLELRFTRMCDSAEVIARRLAEHPAVACVRYPGLSNSPLTAQMARPGFLIGFELPSAEAAERAINACPLLEAGTSFGGVHSSAERRARWGDAVPPGFVRLSVGIEPVEALWSALDAALRGA